MDEKSKATAKTLASPIILQERCFEPCVMSQKRCQTPLEILNRYCPYVVTIVTYMQQYVTCINLQYKNRRVVEVYL
jgi:hypothetical protein